MAPGQIAKDVGKIQPSFYYFESASWDTALSTGALEKMTTEQVGLFASAAIDARTFSALEEKVFNNWVEVESYFEAHPTLNPQQVDEARGKLQMLRRYLIVFDHLTRGIFAGHWKRSWTVRGRAGRRAVVCTK